MNVAGLLDEDECWQSHLQRLHRQFYEEADDRCLLWVNPAQGDPFGDDPLVEERRIRVPIYHANFDVKLAPYLVPLELGKSRDADRFKRSVEMAWGAWQLESLQAFNGQPIGGWIVSEQSPKSLAQHWASNCHIHSLGGLKKLLRFHDPSVREWLWESLSPQQQARLLGPATYVVAFNRQQELMTHRSVASSAHANDLDDSFVESTFGKLLLTREQWEQINDYAVVHRAWLRNKMAESDFSQVKIMQAAWEQPVFRALRVARTYGINDPQDRDLFASHALLLGEKFHEHKRMQRIWEMTRCGEYYGYAVEEVSGKPVDELIVYLKSN